MAHSGAFQCSKCPENNNPAIGRSCPVWWETVLTNAEGETKVVRSCGWEQLPQYLTHFAKTNASAAAAVESTRNEVVRGLSGIMRLVHEATPQLSYTYPDKQLARSAKAVDGEHHEDVPADCNSEQ